jgi:hypothetical protein
MRSSEGHPNRRPRFSYRGAGALLVLAAAGILFTTWSVLAPTERPAHQPERPPAEPPPRLTTPPAAEEPPEAPEPSEDCPEGCTSAKPGCDIKGNISKTGERIYHLPGQRWYSRTEISPEDGERWFCTEEEAEANGWRRAKV